MGTDSEMTYSVLMAVYGKESPEFFRQSIESMLAQTLPFSDFVLVCDGPLPRGLNEVVAWAQEQMGERLQIVRLKENKGLGNALRVGVPKCRCSVIARMDSDDISRPDRCERQFRIIERDGYDLVSGTGIFQKAGRYGQAEDPAKNFPGDPEICQKKKSF